MKKVLAVFIGLALLGSFDTKAQSFETGVNIFNAGFGFGYYNYGYGYGRVPSVPAITANYEVGIDEFIGVGPYIGYISWNYRGPNFEGGYSIVAVGGRVSIHVTDILLNKEWDLNIDEEWDIYFTLVLGMNFDAYTGDFTTDERNRARLNIGPALGVRYHFNERFSGFLELGRSSISYGTMGVSVRI